MTSRQPAGVITAIRPTTVTVPLEAPLRHANGVHQGRFVRTLVEVDTSAGLTGLGELGGGGESAEAGLRAMQSYLLGHDPFDLEALRFKIMNPTASLYNNRTQIHAALEFACLDLMGQALDLRVCDLLGGALRGRVSFASYLFFRGVDPVTGAGGEASAEQMVGYTRALVDRFGFTTHKLKAGVFPPDYEVDVYLELARNLPGHRFRIDPNGVWTVEESIRIANRIDSVRNDYFEDPTWGLEGMRRVRERIGIPTATNQVVVNFEQLATSIRLDAVDVVLLDTTFWGGLRQAVKAGNVCETFGVGVSVHSSGELGVQLATMLHLGAVLPNLTFAADAHYHHLLDDVIAGGPMAYVDGAISVPSGPGLGVRLDHERVARYAEAYQRLGGYHYDRDPERPGWFPLVPAHEYAAPPEPEQPGLAPGAPGSRTENR